MPLISTSGCRRRAGGSGMKVPVASVTTSPAHWSAGEVAGGSVAPGSASPAVLDGAGSCRLHPCAKLVALNRAAVCSTSNICFMDGNQRFRNVHHHIFDQPIRTGAIPSFRRCSHPNRIQLRAPSMERRGGSSLSSSAWTNNRCFVHNMHRTRAASRGPEQEKPD